MLNINDYASCASYINTFISGIDFSNVSYKEVEDIDFSTFDFSEIPAEDFRKADTKVDGIKSLLDEVSESLKSSRLSAEKKESVKQSISYTIENINTYNTLNDIGYIRNDKYDKLTLIKNILADLSTRAPMAVRSQLEEYSRILHSELNNLYRVRSRRNYFFKVLAQKLIEESEKIHVKEYKKELENKNWSIQELKSILNDNEKTKAAIDNINERFGNGASELLWTILHSKNNNLIILNWTRDEYINNIFNFARNLGLKEIGFEGNSSAAFSNLNTITKLGLSFKIIEIEKTNYMGRTISPVAIISL